ncbi:G5 domain-containing protein [Micromonospora sp. NPDC126480]|uniref:G5 domain-containing protein n=1 Tax=Micromonospora sp. NPDC126480 TaxID=3155312 RepID=UPI0033183907
MTQPLSNQPSPTWFHRLGPGRRASVILGGALLSVVLLCCAGTAVVSAVFGEPQPQRTGTSADAAPEPVVAASAESAPSESTPSEQPSEVTPSATAASPMPSPVVEVRTVTATQRIPHATRTVKDSSLAQGKRVVRTRGVDGVRTLTYEVTVTDGVQTGRKLIGSEVTKKPVTEVVAVGTKPASRCDPNYSPCVPIASDVDCAGGGGNGPAYVTGPVKVIGTDIYDLDRDNDGWGCD